MKIDSRLNFFLGIPTIIVLAFFYGLFTSPDYWSTKLLSFFSFVLVTIICTAGIALVFWIPLLIVLGAITNKIIGLLFKQRWQQLSEKMTGKTEDNGINVNYSSNNEAAIVGYIVLSRKTGTMSDAVIRSNLKNSGWSDTAIDDAFNKCA